MIKFILLVTTLGVIGVVLQMIYIYSPSITSSKSLKLKLSRISKVYSEFTRGKKVRQILASPMIFPPIPLLNTDQKFYLYSLVPVRSQKTFNGASLAIIGKKNPKAANDTFGNHFLKYNDNSVNKLFKIRKYGGVSETIWYAEMPDEIAKIMFNPLSPRACTNLTVFLGENKTVVKSVAHLEVCHNPSVLPQLENKVKMAYCINQPPFFSSKSAYKKALLQGELSGSMAHVVQNILYHLLHSGVDLFIIYVPFSIRQLYLRLLEPVVQKYAHQLLFVDLSSKWGGQEFLPYRRIDKLFSPSVIRKLRTQNRINTNGRKDQRTYDLRDPLSQDCLNRLKGHSHFFRTIDIDEYDMVFSYSEESKLFFPKPMTNTKDIISKIKTETFDCLNLNKLQFILEGMDNEKNLLQVKNYMPLRATGMKKCICQPEDIAVTWCHRPITCFNRKCKLNNISFPEYNATDTSNSNGSKNKGKKKLLKLGYAHIKMDHFFKKHVNESATVPHDFTQLVKENEEKLLDLFGTYVPANLLKAKDEWEEIKVK